MTNELTDADEKHSEIEPTTEGNNTKLFRAFLDLAHYDKFLDIQKAYRSPSLSHTFRLMIEDWQEKEA